MVGQQEQIKKLDLQVSQSDFWSNSEQAQKIMQELNARRDEIGPLEAAQRQLDDLQLTITLAEDEDDDELWAEAAAGITELQKELGKLELAVIFRGRYDHNSAIIAIHPGAGGTESQDWAAMLLRMYTRWAERKSYQVEVLDLLPGDEAGIKSATLLVTGKNAYGYLKAERGVHRLVRISPFDAASRRHTSFASLDVLPDVEDTDQDIELRPEDLKIDTYRASGAGGQHVNTTDSAVRITHLPTGFTVQCQNERSQHSNRERALTILRARLADYYERERLKKISNLRGEQKEIGWGSQIRSYVFHPYTLVKDHRTGVDVGNVNAVMDGELDQLIESYLRQTAGKDV